MKLRHVYAYDAATLIDMILMMPPLLRVIAAFTIYAIVYFAATCRYAIYAATRLLFAARH